MSFEIQFKKFVEEEIKKGFKSSEGLKYALFPAGKLFRPKLFLEVAKELKIPLNQSLLRFAFFLETHHAYTLVHDDLPSMDNDLIRRGKASTHAKFGEWQALLIGDALLNLSYAELSKVRTEYLQELIAFSHWCVGYQGLIEGQFQDLSHEPISFEQVLRAHELKTGRLILLATVAPIFFSEQWDLKVLKKLWRLGSLIGVVFQVKDDKEDFEEGQKEMNIFNVDFKRADLLLEKTSLKLERELEQNGFFGVKNFISSFN